MFISAYLRSSSESLVWVNYLHVLPIFCPLLEGQTCTSEYLPCHVVSIAAFPPGGGHGGLRAFALMAPGGSTHTALEDRAARGRDRGT